MAFSTIMKYDHATELLQCITPSGKLVLEIVERDIVKSHAISDAIQQAYENGRAAAIRDMRNYMYASLDSFE